MCSGACDMVLVESPDFEDGLGLKIHIRTKIKSWFSYIESAAIQIGSDILEGAFTLSGQSSFRSRDLFPSC